MKKTNKPSAPRTTTTGTRVLPSTELRAVRGGGNVTLGSGFAPPERNDH